MYVGRTSGYNDPEINVRNRDYSHHKNAEGFGKAELVYTSENYDAIRGLEQILIDHYGGAKSQGGTSGNTIRGISLSNPKLEIYMNAAKEEFK